MSTPWIDALPNASEVYRRRAAREMLLPLSTPWPELAERMRARYGAIPSEYRPYVGGGLPDRPTSANLAPPAPRRRLSLVLPWACLVADNAKSTVARGGIIRLTPEYRAAKKAARAEVERQLMLIDAPPLDGPLALAATFVEPDRSRRRDIANYAKLSHDALTGLAYHDDSQLDDVRWRRGVVDATRPRLELILTPITPLEL